MLAVDLETNFFENKFGAIEQAATTHLQRSAGETPVSRSNTMR